MCFTEVIYVDEDELVANGFPINATYPNPDDKEEGWWSVYVFHQLHCLVSSVQFCTNRNTSELTCYPSEPHSDGPLPRLLRPQQRSTAEYRASPTLRRDSTAVTSLLF